MWLLVLEILKIIIAAKHRTLNVTELPVYFNVTEVNTPILQSPFPSPGLISWSGRSPGEENGYPLQYSCRGDPIDRGAWQAKAMGSKELEMTEQLNMCPIILRGY